MTLLRWPKRDLVDEEPPSKVHKDTFKLHIPSSWDIHSVIFGCGVSPQSRYHFGSLVALSGVRRGSILAANKEDKIGR